MDKDKISGEVKIDKKTKRLVKRLNAGNIAVINHQDLDEIAAHSLIKKKPAAVINIQKSISGKYPNPGPDKIVEKGIIIIDEVGQCFLESVEEGDVVTIKKNKIYRDGNLIGEGVLLDAPLIDFLLKEAGKNLEVELDNFVENTLKYAQREKDIILGWLDIPDIITELEDKHVLVVVRGKNYREDLQTITAYIEEMNPVIIGVDGGADAVVEAGFSPDIIIGDMDSVSQKVLLSGAELIVHAYENGQAPGLERLRRAELNPVIFPAPGTSEDIALLLAFEKGASLIVAVGTHTSMIDFLEKGRKGMASTFLVRLKIGSILVDAKGVSRLYRARRPKPHELTRLVLSAFIPVVIIVFISVPFRQYLRLLIIRLWLLIGI